jgi:hypothetical protein
MQYKGFQRLLHDGRHLHEGCGVSTVEASPRTIVVQCATTCFIHGQRAGAGAPSRNLLMLLMSTIPKLTQGGSIFRMLWRLSAGSRRAWAVKAAQRLDADSIAAHDSGA